MNLFGHRVNGRERPARRLTAGALGYSYGPDRGRRLVVTLAAGDLILFRPERTRQTVSLLAVDAYRYALRCLANAGHLAKARERKAALAERRQRSRLRF